MRILLGFIIVLVGLQMFLGSIGVNNIPSLSVWWPIIIIAIGFLSWRSNPKLFAWPLFMIVFGIIFLVSNLGIIPGNGWSYLWPVLLVLIGGQIMFGREGQSWSNATKQGNGRGVMAFFSGRNEVVVGPFASGQASGWFGGVKYDLRQAEIAEQASLECMAAFGGIEILVPKHVRVVTNVTPIFGGCENKTTSDAGVTKTVTIHGTALFGGIEIKN